MANFREVKTILARILRGKGTRVYVGGVEQFGPSDPALFGELLQDESINSLPGGRDSRQRNTREAVYLLSAGDMPAEQLLVEGNYPNIGAPDDGETVFNAIAAGIGGGGGAGGASFWRRTSYPSGSYLNYNGVPSSSLGFSVGQALVLTGISAELGATSTVVVRVENESFVEIATLSITGADQGLVSGLSVALPAGDELRVRVTSASTIPETSVTVSFGMP